MKRSSAFYRKIALALDMFDFENKVTHKTDVITEDYKNEISTIYLGLHGVM